MTALEKVGIISLGEAGNLGDDLILISVVEALLSTSPVQSVAYLSHGQTLNWQLLCEQLGLDTIPTRRRSPGGAALAKSFRTLFADRQAIVMGGGGLFQSVHHPLRPYHWLRYVPNNVPVLGIGLGFGPLSSRWMRLLGSVSSPFSNLHVRDDESLAMVREFGWPASRSADCVYESLVQRLVTPRPATQTLGVAIRAWPNLDARTVAAGIERSASREGCTSVAAFVLEATAGVGPDVEFTREVLRLLGIPHELYIYDPADLTEFLASMSQCRAAVSMKLHSSVLWGYMRIPIYPISYAPKTAALFGVEWRGLEVFDAPLAPVLSEDGVPSTRAVIHEWVTSGSRIPPTQPFRPDWRLLSAESLTRNTLLKVRNLAK